MVHLGNFSSILISVSSTSVYSIVKYFLFLQLYMWCTFCVFYHLLLVFSIYSTLLNSYLLFWVLLGIWHYCIKWYRLMCMLVNSDMFCSILKSTVTMTFMYKVHDWKSSELLSVDTHTLTPNIQALHDNFSGMEELWTDAWCFQNCRTKCWHCHYSRDVHKLNLFKYLYKFDLIYYVWDVSW